MPDSLSAGFALGVATTLLLGMVTVAAGIWWTLETETDDTRDE